MPSKTVSTPRRATDAEALAVWKRYRETGDLRERNRLVTMYLGMVKYLVHRKSQELPLRLELDDLMSCGVEGLIHAIERFDPAKGGTIEQLAWIRVEGAIIDELRRQDWAPRSVRRGERSLHEAQERFAALHGRKPDDHELADAAGMTYDDVKGIYGDLRRAHVSSLNAPAWRDESATTEQIDTLVADDELNPEQATLRSEAYELLRAALRNLPDQERQVAVMLYERGLSQREVGEALQLTESRISQIHTKLRNALRLALSNNRDVFDAVA
jgi:RNA polymerase sigma factor for flagellar operon FliA